MPTPTTQESIERAEIVPEFFAYLRHLVASRQRLVIINLQDRTTWKGHSRSLLLEELQKHAEYAETLLVVTLAKETEFYYQDGPYVEINKSSDFLDQFQMHLEDEQSGYYFPPALREVLFPEWTRALLEKIHLLFFEEKNTLTVKARRAFIDITHLFIALKAADFFDPQYLTFLSKDGLDLGACEVVELLVLLQGSKKEGWHSKELAKLSALLFGQTLLIRERNIQKKCFERFLQAIKWLEIEREGDVLKLFSDLLEI
jgi:hypothetical protein